MLYADYNYYTNTYMGNLSGDTFKSLIPKASKMIDRSINTILDEENFEELSKKAQDSVHFTACALIDLINEKKQSDERKISSFSIDGVSKTFKIISDDEYKKKLQEALGYLPDELTRYL